jgi:uncharacterized protein (TIGR03435 family)
MFALASLATFAVDAQTPAFEVASVRPSGAAVDRVDIGLRWDGAQVRITSLPLRSYVALAYRLKIDQVTGPDWASTERYDLQATLPAGSKQADLPEMLQALLTERFQLKFHREQKEFPVYLLTLGKGPLLFKESADTAERPQNEGFSVAGSGSSAGVAVNLGNGSYYSFANNKLEGKKLTLPAIADTLESYVDRQVVEQTGLKGAYDVSIEVSQDDYRTMLVRAGSKAGITLPPRAMQLLETNPVPTSLIDAIERQGLKMEARKMPLDVVVVDQVLRKPTEN